MAYFVILSLPLFMLIFIARSRSRWLEIFPSIFWYFFMSLPFVLLSGFVDSPILSIQFVGILIFSISIFASDLLGCFWPIRRTFNSFSTEKAFNKNVRSIIVFLVVALLIGIPVLQVLFTHVIPLADALFTNKGGIDLNDARQEFTKGADFPIVLELMLAWYIPLIACLGIYTLLRIGAKFTSIVVFAFVLLFSIMGLEKMPLIFFSLSMFLASLFLLAEKRDLAKYATFAIIFFLIMFSGISKVYVTEVSKDMDLQSNKEYTYNELEGVFTPSDSYRLDSRPNSILPAPVVGLIYRSFLTPIDVSFRWYQYYSKDRNSQRNIVKVITYTEYPKATNVVGRWAFTDRFPEKYTDYIDAYSSIDSDSYSMLGLFGVVLSAFIIFIFRFIFLIFKYKSQFSLFAYGLAISYLSFMPFQSGIMSLLISKGLLLILCLVVAPTFFALRGRFTYARMNKPEN